MIIRTLQEANLANCCSCRPAACDAPRFETESLTVDACGYELPSHPNVPTGEACIIYKTQTYSLYQTFFQQTYSSGFPGATQSNENDYTTDIGVTKEYIYSGHVCTERTVSTSFTETHDFTGYTEPVNHELTVKTSSSSLSSPCSGSRTFNEEDPEPYNVCPAAVDTPDEEWTFSSPSTFSLITEDHDDTKPFTYQNDTTRSVVYSDPIDSTVLLEELDTIAFPSSLAGNDTAASYKNVDSEGCEQIASLTKIRYRVGIPETDGYAGFDAAHEAWITAHGDWESENPETRGPEPREPVERSVYELEWDEVFFPAEWGAWALAKNAFDEATAAHEAWEAEDPETRGDEPIIPDDPGTEPTVGPSLVSSESWEYDGDEFSGWFNLAAPEAPGEVRVVNMMVVCWHSNRLGMKPTSTGEICELEEE
jgi:hypothetical protein